MYPERVVKALQRARAHIQAGHPELALPDLEKAVQKSPKGFEAWFILGQARGLLGEHALAEACLKRAAVYQPKNADLWFNLGIGYSSRAMYDQAIDCYQKSIQYADTFKVEACHNLGSCLLAIENYEEAVDVFQTLLRFHDTADLQALLGISLQGLGDYPAAIAAYTCAQQRGMNNYTLHLNLGTCHFTCHDYVQSIQFTENALGLKPGDAVAQYNLARSLLEQGEIAKSCAILSQCSLPAAGPAGLFALNFMEPHDPVAILEQHRAWGARQALVSTDTHDTPANRDKPLRLGFISADLRHHPVAFFLERLIAHIDRSVFSIHFYADVQSPDEVTDRFRGMADGWSDISGIQDASQVARLIQAQDIDILFDLGGHTSERIRLFANRLAPVQASYLGYGATSGMPEMDYFLTDHCLDPQGLTETHYGEKLCRLGDAFATYAPPDNAPALGALPMLQSGYPVFGAFHKLTKISPLTIALWSKVLQAVPNAKMLLMAKGLEFDSGQQRIRDAFAAHGIGPERLDLRGSVAFGDYLAAHNEVDLLLDCFPWNSHTTAMHALWMGVPTLTLQGQHHVGRFGEFVLRALQLDQLVAHDEQEFIASATRLTSDTALLQTLRASARERLGQSILCDHSALASRFAQACRAMWRNHCDADHKAISIQQQ